MAGLEWSTGSSTQWVLMRVKSLISIEHHAKWSKVCGHSASVQDGSCDARLPHLARVGLHFGWLVDFSFVIASDQQRCLLAQNVAESLAKIFDKQFLAQRWELHAVEPLPG